LTTLGTSVAKHFTFQGRMGWRKRRGTVDRGAMLVRRRSPTEGPYLWAGHGASDERAGPAIFGEEAYRGKLGEGKTPWVQDPYEVGGTRGGQGGAGLGKDWKGYPPQSLK